MKLGLVTPWLKTRVNQIAVIRKEVLEAVHGYENTREDKGVQGFMSIQTNHPKL
jgi:hypothetical protein